MLFNVPQNIDVEDKVAGPFTGKQLLWMFAMGGVLLVAYGTLDQASFYISAIPIVLIFCALAFYKPNGVPLIKFIYFAASYIIYPKMYIWKREAEKARRPEIKKEVKPAAINKEEMMSAENVASLARIMDSEGQETNEKILELIKKKKQKK